MSKILWGVCGIGHGHIFRQLPLIDHFARDNDIVIFGYGESYDFYKSHFADHPRVTVERVAVPYIPGGPEGLDFAAAAQLPENRMDYTAINAAAMRAARARLGRPDLVVSDYEPVCAQYAYAMDAPLVTVDQQSKYLCGDFPEPLNRQYYRDEIERLRMFFPKAEKRLASTFFSVSAKGATDVTLCPPVLGDAILDIRRQKSATPEILIYLSAQKPFGQSFDDIAAACAAHPGVTFHLFGKNIPAMAAANVKTYRHGDPAFHVVLARCHGVVSTAGHTLLSESMYLGIPVCAVPLPLYEQEMNARAVADGGFGIATDRLDAAVLSQFLDNLPAYESAIAADKTRLLRGPGQGAIIRHLNEILRPLKI
jgi:uncharacterized protein (TIGR00661 family)